MIEDYIVGVVQYALLEVDVDARFWDVEKEGTEPDWAQFYADCHTKTQVEKSGASKALMLWRIRQRSGRSRRANPPHR